MNFETLKYIVEYTRAQETNKEIQFSLEILLKEWRK